MPCCLTIRMLKAGIRTGVRRSQIACVQASSNSAAWEQRQESLCPYDQQALVSLLKAERPALAGVQSQVLQHVAVRLDLALQAGFRRVGVGEERPSYPRFRGRGRYDRLTRSQVPAGCKLHLAFQRLRVMNF